MKVSVVAGQPDLGAWKTFFNEEKESQNSVKVSIIIEDSVEKQGLPQHLLTVKHIDYPEILNKNIATHVIVGVQIARRIIISCEIRLKEEQDRNQALADLKFFAKKMTMPGTMNLTTREQDMLGKMKWTVHSDFEAPQTISNLDEVRDLCLHAEQRVPFKPVQTTFWLTPLNSILPKVARSIIISSETVETIISLVDQNSEVNGKFNDLVKLDCLQFFPNFIGELMNFQKIAQEASATFKAELKVKLLEIRSGNQKEDELSTLLAEKEASPFGHTNFKKWSQKAEEMANFLINAVNMVTTEARNIQLCSSKEEFLSIQNEKVFNLTINSLFTNSQFSSEPTQRKQMSTKYKGFPGGKFVEALSIVEQFKSFAEANEGSLQHTFVVTESCPQTSSGENDKLVSMKMVLNCIEEPCPTLPSQPQNVTVEEFSHQKISVSWENPKFGSENITSYTLKATEASLACSRDLEAKCSKGDALQLQLNGLSCGTTYSLALQCETAFGVSPPYHVQVTTLAAGPPQDLRVSLDDKKGIWIQWKHPVEKNFEINLIGYKIRMDIQNEKEGGLDQVKEEIVGFLEGHHLECDINKDNKYLVTVTTLTERSSGFYSSVQFCNQNDSDLLSHSFQHLRQALANNPAKNTAQFGDHLSHLLNLKQEIQGCLQDPTKIIFWTNELIQREEFTFIINHLVKLSTEKEFSQEFQNLKKLTGNLLLPYNEEYFPIDNEHIETIFQIFQNPQINLENSLEGIKMTIGNILQGSGQPSFRDLVQQINNLLNVLKNINKVSLLVGVETLLHSFGYNLETKLFELVLDNSAITLLLNRIHLLLSTISKNSATENEMELAILWGFAEFEKSPKHLFEKYILLKEEKLPSETTKNLTKYLNFWKDNEIRQVLTVIQGNADFEKFLVRAQKNQIEVKTFKKSETTKFKLASIENFSNQSERHKLSRNDVYAVDLFDSELLSENGKYLKFLKQLLSMDHHCRNQTSSKVKKIEVKQELNEDDFFFNSQPVCAVPQPAANEMSNSDLIQKTLAICDDILLQDVYDKMSSCQLAVPIICLKENSLQFNLWATRTIKKKWVSSIPGHDSLGQEQLISSKKMGTISFCRIGSTKISKSKLANLFLSSAQGWPEHPYFLHRDLDSESKLIQGSVEACWYCPENRPREHLQDIHCIYNLRGDVRDSKEQFKFLLKVSSVLVVLLDNAALQKDEIDLLKSMDGKIILVSLGTSGDAQTMGKILKLNVVDLNLKALSEAIIVNVPVISAKQLSLEEHAQMAKEKCIFVDESSEACNVGKIAAQQFLDKLKQFDIGSLKAFVVPLQGKNWQQWGKHDKEESRHQFIGDKNPQAYSSHLRDLKNQMRRNQLETGPSQEVQFFLDKVWLFRNTPVLQYFLLWCQMGLNEMSEQHLPVILKEYNQSAKELSKLTKELETLRNSSGMNDLQHNLIGSLIDGEKTKIKTLSDRFSVASFGIEHVFREFSQIYESHENENQQKAVSHLPKIMAELFIMGHPLEIMDGDASHVPLTWAKQVLLEVKKKLGKDINVFVLSILGIQSSGKSTLLNTMFGSKFPVSSGRCTKGVFLQLVPVSRNLQQQLHCDYFIIMDSEGLRSPELSDSFRHDNEIATLVACLANTTIINFWGQTFSKDMSDIMQIAAHAYIRMKEVKIKSSFHMVFAGVPDVTAADKNQLGVGKILNELNGMILRIARDEGRSDIFSGLSSIFPLLQEQFTDLNFPEFLPALWQGSMCPPESRYGEIVQQLKDAICIGLMQYQGQTLRGQPLSEFTSRLTDVWEAIKQENFIFGFKNSQAVEVFAELQKVYDKELIQMRKTFFELSYQVAEESLLEVAELKDEDEGFRRYSKKVAQRIEPEVEQWQDKIIEQLKAHMLQMSDPEMAAPHLGSFSLDLKKKVSCWLDKEKQNTRQKINSVCRKEKTVPVKREQFKKKCLVKAREVAGDLKGGDASTQIDDNVIEAAFSDIFNMWVHEAHQEDNETTISTETILEQIWNDSADHLFEKLKILYPAENAEILKMISCHFHLIKGAFEDKTPLCNDPLIPERDLDCTANWLKRQFSSLAPTKSTEVIEQAKKRRSAIVQIAKNSLNESKRNFSSREVIFKFLSSTFEALKKPAASDFDFSNSFRKNFLMAIFGYAVKEMVKAQANQNKKNPIFCHIWNDSVGHLTGKLKLLHPKNGAELNRKIEDHFSSIKEMHDQNAFLCNIPLSLEKDLNCTDNWVKLQLRSSSRKQKMDILEQAKRHKNAIVEKTKSILNESRRKHTSHFSCTDAIAQVLDEAFDSLNCQAAQHFDFSKDFKNQALIVLFGFAVKQMVIVQEEHNQKNSMEAFVVSLRNELYQEFSLECKTADSDARAGMRFINHIICPIVMEQVKLTVGSKIFDAMIAQKYFSQKNNMMFQMLKELLQASFGDVSSYISDYKSYVKTWISDEVRML